MKNIFSKSNLLSFMLGAILFGGIGVYAANEYNANLIKYNETNVESALNDLYDLTNYGTASASDILSGKTALINGIKVTGTAADPTTKYDEGYNAGYSAGKNAKISIVISNYINGETGWQNSSSITLGTSVVQFKNCKVWRK